MSWTRCKITGSWTRDNWAVVKTARTGWCIRYRGHTGPSFNTAADAKRYADTSGYAERFAQETDAQLAKKEG